MLVINDDKKKPLKVPLGYFDITAFGHALIILNAIFRNSAIDEENKESLNVFFGLVGITVDLSS